MSSSGLLSGTATTISSTGSIFTVTATDGANNSNSASLSYTVSVLAEANLTFTNPANFNVGQAGTVILVNFTKANGVSAYPTGSITYTIVPTGNGKQHRPSDHCNQLGGRGFGHGPNESYRGRIYARRELYR